MKFLLSLLLLCVCSIAQSWTQTLMVGAPYLTIHAGAYSFMEQKLITFGGFNGSWVFQGNTYVYDGVNWTVGTGPGPSQRIGHAMAYDWIRGRVVLFGGAPNVFGSNPYNDTWEYFNGTWIQVYPSTISPSPRYGHAMSYDATLGKVVLFGGRIVVPFATFYDDTWEWDGATWVRITMNAAGTPPGRSAHAICYDLIRQKTVMFGGLSNWNGPMTQLADTWTYDGTTWNFVANGSPSGRSGHGMAFDMSRSVVVMHGGSINSTETWEWDGYNWSPTLNVLDRVNSLVYYDAGIQKIALFGGSKVNTSIMNNEMWTYGMPITGSYTSYGTGCPGNAGQAMLFEPGSQPIGPMIGQTSFLCVASCYWDIFFVFGWANANINLAQYGMPGCTLLVVADQVLGAGSNLGSVTIPIAVPFNQLLAGSIFFVQAFPVDLSINPAGLVSTNGLMATIGRL